MLTTEKKRSALIKSLYKQTTILWISKLLTNKLNWENWTFPSYCNIVIWSWYNRIRDDMLSSFKPPQTRLIENLQLEGKIIRLLSAKRLDRLDRVCS